MLVHWFKLSETSPDEDTDMWVVEHEFECDSSPSLSVEHLDSVVHAFHLIPVFGRDFIPVGLHFSETLDIYTRFYVNKFVDLHSHKIVF